MTLSCLEYAGCHGDNFFSDVDEIAVEPAAVAFSSRPMDSDPTAFGPASPV
jgi:hypothetical protein